MTRLSGNGRQLYFETALLQSVYCGHEEQGCVFTTLSPNAVLLFPARPGRRASWKALRSRDSSDFYFLRLELDVDVCALGPWHRASFQHDCCLQFCITHAPRQRKQLPLRRLNIMENKPFSLRSRPFLGRWSPSNRCLTTPLYKLVLSFCPLIRDIPSSEVLKD